MALKRIKSNPIPRFQKGKTHKDMRIVRPIELEEIFDAVDTNTENIETLENSLIGKEDAYIYIEREVSAVEFLDLHNNPIVLVPAPGADKFFDYARVVVEFTQGPTPYAGTKEPYVGVNSSQQLQIPVIGIQSDSTKHYMRTLTVHWDNQFFIVNHPFKFAAGGALSAGNGTALIKAWYSIGSIGSNL